MTRKVIYAGSFDPITNGHIDLIKRAVALFDELILAVAHNYRKNGFFSVEERMELMRLSTADIAGIVEIDTFSGLMIDYAKRKNATAVIRGLRAVSDFEFEQQMALTNRRMSPNFRTVFLMPHQDFAFLSSSLVKEIAENGGDVASFVPPVVAERLYARMRERKTE